MFPLCSFPAFGSVTKRLLSSHGSEGARKRIITWHGCECCASVSPLGGRRQTRGAHKHTPSAPLPLRVHIPATACHALLCPHLLRATRVPSAPSPLHTSCTQRCCGQ